MEDISKQITQCKLRTHGPCLQARSYLINGMDKSIHYAHASSTSSCAMQPHDDCVVLQIKVTFSMIGIPSACINVGAINGVLPCMHRGNLTACTYMYMYFLCCGHMHA